MDSVIKLLLNNLVEEEHVEERHGFLPDRKVRSIWNCYDNNGGFGVVMVLPSGRYDMALDDRVYKDVGVPKLLFGFRVENERIVRSKAGVVLDEVVKPDSLLYHYPFSNVDHGFAICWGGNVLPDIDEPSKLASIPLFFLSIPNSQHSYGKNLTGLKYKKFLKSLEGKDFDNNVLIGAEGRTVADFANILLKNQGE